MTTPTPNPNPNPFDVRPMPGVLYGVTHQEGGQPIVRLPRTVKLSIGLPAGKKIDVAYHEHNDGNWVVKLDDKMHRFQDIAAAQRFYGEQYPKAAEQIRPNKRSTFTARATGPDGVLVPDWKTIEAMGSSPTKVDIVFTNDMPLDSSYMMWAPGRLKCFGDGHNALRVIEEAKTPEHKKLAEQAKEKRLKHFPIVDGCHERGCPFAEPTTNAKNQEVAPACKPFGRLSFQLINNIGILGRAEITTTSYASIAYLASGILELKRITGGGDPTRGFVAGIPLQLVIVPSKNKHGKVYHLGLSFHAESVAGLRRKLLAYGAEFREGLIAEAAPKQIGAPVAVEELFGEEAIDPEEAAAIMAEFAMGQDEEAGEEDFTDPENAERPTPAAKAEAATAQTAVELRESIRAAREKKQGPVATAPEKPEPRVVVDGQQVQPEAVPVVETKVPGDKEPLF